MGMAASLAGSPLGSDLGRGARDATSMYTIYTYEYIYIYIYTYYVI